MATLVRVDDLYINLDNVTRIEVHPEAEEVLISFGAGTFHDGFGASPCADSMTLKGEQGARFLRWLDAGGRVSEAPAQWEADDAPDWHDRRAQREAVAPAVDGEGVELPF